MSRHAVTKKPVGQDWHKADIKAALEKRGWSLRRLALSLGLTDGVLRDALRKRYPASERRIADALGVHPKLIWPSRYNEDGTPNSRRGNPNWLSERPRSNDRSTRTGGRHAKGARAN